MRLVLTFLMAMSAVAVLVLGAAPASAMTGQGGCHDTVAVTDHGAGHESPVGMDAHVMHCCVACTPEATAPSPAPSTLAGQARAALTLRNPVGRAPSPDPDPPRA